MRKANSESLLYSRLAHGAELEKQQKFLHALQIYHTIMLEHPDFSEAYYKTAEMYERLGNTNAGIKILRELAEANPAEADIKLNFGQYLFRNRRWGETIKVLYEIDYSDEPLVLFLLGYSHMMLEEYERAVSEFKLYLSFDENSVYRNDVYLYLGKCHVFLEKTDTASEYLEKCGLDEKEDFELPLYRAICYFKSGMAGHAKEQIDIALAGEKKDTYLYEWAGRIYIETESFHRLEKILLAFLEESEGSSIIYTYLGIALKEQKKAEAALGCFRIARQLNPHNQFLERVIEAYGYENEV
ncbi:MAG: tetratricopeptide repeat protein [Ignavibacteriaceae bacterium]|nr:tetratricopeptide repeat protein [Ignavibacteriaceae bacterium]